VAGCGHVDIAAGFVRFRFHGEAIFVAAINVVFAEEIHGFAQALDGFVRAAAGIGFHAFTATPEDEGFCSEFGAEIHGAHCFLQSIGADFRIVCRKSAIAKHR